MKALSGILVLAFAAGIGLMGCSDNAEPLVAPESQAEAISLDKMGPIVHSVTGTGQFYLAYGGPTGTVPVPKGEQDFKNVGTINAKEYADGTYGGRFKANNGPGANNPYGVWGGEVTQLMVEDNIAKIIFDVTDGPAHVCYVVVDNGEGSNAEPDLCSWFFGAPPETPMIQALYGMSPSEALNWFIVVGNNIGFPGDNVMYVGNIQVR